MKAKIKATGEIINIASYTKITLDKCDSYGTPIEVRPEDVELIDNVEEDSYWQNVRVQAAIAAMQGVMKYFGSIDKKWTIAKLAVEHADALIKQLKEK
jgi:hypothetical protein